ncbi:hypothetical protein MKW98_026622 [Papaver atlanticum]|uniref:Uncharacterized protein n=1 Tax=Papaver atlanticum TaxID=357466 RepID=A0AAD4X5B6_9MAGN|nr:hypothetical protein MKW98_026622 [Papaver atlanticum]
MRTSTLNDLVYGGGEPPIGEVTLHSILPGRVLQIDELIILLGPVNSPILPLFFYGDASTGKTSCILQIFGYLKRPFIYLLRHAGNDGYVSAKQPCERPADFVNFLRNGFRSREGRVEDESVFERAEVGGADVLLQLSTPCNAKKFFAKAETVEGSTWHGCTVIKEFVMQVAKSVPFPLLRYLCKT